VLLSLLCAAVVLVAPMRRRRAGSAVPDLAAEYEAVAAELRRGASLRVAIAGVYPGSKLAGLAMSGQPMSWVAAELERRADHGDQLIGAGLQLAATSGASAAPMFVALADRVRTQRDIASKRRVLAAQARASALVIGVIPLVIGLLLVATRSFGSLATSPPARLSVLIGAAMEIVGAGLVIVIARRAGR